MKILLATPRGFCAGVERAVEAANQALEKYGAPVYIKHALIHNTVVIKELEKRGAITVESLLDAPEGAVIVFSAHGSPPQDYQLARQRHQTVLDSTCPLVEKIHSEAKLYDARGETIILLGHKDHVETKGTSGYAPSIIIDERDKSKLEQMLADLPRGTPLAVISQTTLSVDDTQSAVESIKARFPEATIRNDICYATTNRQHAVKQLIAKGAKAVVIIGSKTSSNANRMKDIAASTNIPAYLADNADEVIDKLADYDVIGVSSGASTPERQTEEFCDALKKRHGAVVEEFISKEENVTFRQLSV